MSLMTCLDERIAEVEMRVAPVEAIAKEAAERLSQGSDWSHCSLTEDEEFQELLSPVAKIEDSTPMRDFSHQGIAAQERCQGFEERENGGPRSRGPKRKGRSWCGHPQSHQLGLRGSLQVLPEPD